MCKSITGGLKLVVAAKSGLLLIFAVATTLSAQPRISESISLLSAPSVVSPSMSDAENGAIASDTPEAVKLRKEVLDDATRLAKDFPARIEPIYTLGLAHQRTGNIARAQEYWNKCLQMDPQYADAMVSLAEVNFDNGKYEETLDLYQKALKIYGDDLLVPVEIGKTLISLGRFEEAATVLKEYLTRHPGTARCHNYLGTVFLQLKQYEKAKTHHLKALSFETDNEKAHYGLTTVYARLGKKDQSLEHRKKFTALKSKSFERMEKGQELYNDVLLEKRNISTIYEKIGVCYKLCNDNSKAIEFLKKAGELDSKNTNCRQLLAKVYQQAGRPEDALDVYRNLTVLHPNNPVSYMHLGTFSARLGRFADAEESFKKVTELAPDRPEGYRSLIQLYLKHSTKLPEAKEFAALLVERNPNAVNYYVLAVLSSRTGDRRLALDSIEKAVNMEPNNQRYKQFFRILLSAK